MSTPRRRLPATGHGRGADPVGGRQQGGAPTAGDVEHRIAAPNTRQIDEALAEVLVIAPGDLVIGRSGTIEHTSDPGLGVVHDTDRTDRRVVQARKTLSNGLPFASSSTSLSR